MTGTGGIAESRLWNSHRTGETLPAVCIIRGAKGKDVKRMRSKPYKMRHRCLMYNVQISCNLRRFRDCVWFAARYRRRIQAVRAMRPHPCLMEVRRRMDRLHATHGRSVCAQDGPVFALQIAETAGVTAHVTMIRQSSACILAVVGNACRLHPAHIKMQPGCIWPVLPFQTIDCP